MRAFLALILFLVSAVTFAGEIEIEGSLRLVGDNPPGQEAPAITPLTEFVIRKGNYQYNVREGRPNYQGVPWNFIIEKRSPGEAQVLFWIAEDDGWFDEMDDPIVNEVYDGATLRPAVYDLYAFPDGSTLQLTLSPKQVPPPLDPLQLTLEDAGLAMFCIKHVQIIMNGTFVLGAITDGFGEEIVIDIPGRSLIVMSLIPSEGDRVIGVYEQGVITIPLKDGHELTLTGLRIGPLGTEPGGPFKVHGGFFPSETTVEQARAYAIEELQAEHTGDRLKALIAAARANPFGGTGRITIRGRGPSSEYIQRFAGSWGSELHACNIEQ